MPREQPGSSRHGGRGAAGQRTKTFCAGIPVEEGKTKSSLLLPRIPESHGRSSPCSLSCQDYSADSFHFCGDTGEAKPTAAPASIRSPRYCLTPRPITSLLQLEARRTQISFREEKEMGTSTKRHHLCTRYLHRHYIPTFSFAPCLHPGATSTLQVRKI